MAWWMWAQLAVDVVVVGYAIALSLGEHDHKDAINALRAEIEDLKRRL